MAESFYERLRRSVAASGPLVVGIDPSPAVARAWGVKSDAAGLRTIARTLLSACGPFAAAIKLQVAFFERLGARGYAALESVLEDARETELLVIADAKRGDIGTSNEGYAEAWLADDSPLVVDALTASPYLGVGALTPLVERAARGGRGVFVLARTSNPEGERLQGARVLEGATVAQDVVSQVRAWNAGPAAGAAGVVVGATVPDALALADLGGAVLVPGVGAQGGTVADAHRVTASAAPDSVVVSVSRALSDFGPDPRRLAAAAQQWRDHLARTLS
ncbi:MAG: orotidine-5'-phosphate decarboxylase [Acidimicrobiales bacterium]